MISEGEYWVNRTCPGICPCCTSCLAGWCRLCARLSACVAQALCMKILELFIIALLIALVIYWAANVPTTALRGARDWAAEQYVAG